MEIFLEEAVSMTVDVERVAALEVRVENLERWQMAQNGTLKEINRKLDKTNTSINKGLDELSKKLEQKTGAVTKWVFGLMGSILVSLVLLILNLAAKLNGG